MTSKCYDPVRWDTYWHMRALPVRDEAAGARDEIFGTPRLVEAWWRAVTTQPARLSAATARPSCGRSSPAPISCCRITTGRGRRRPTAAIPFSSRCSRCTTCCSRPCCSAAVLARRSRSGCARSPAGASDARRRIRRRRHRLGDRLCHDFPGGRGRGRFPLWLLVRARDACRRRRGAAGALRPPDRVSALVSPALRAVWFSSSRSSTGRTSATTLSTILSPSSADAACASPITPRSASRGSSLRQGQLVPRSNTSASMSLRAFGSGDRFGRPISPRRTRSGASASITEVSPFAAVDIETSRVRLGLRQIERVDDAGIEPAIAAQLADQILQDAAIAAVPVDDQEIARRQRADDLVARCPRQADEALERQAQRARRPIVLAREADGDGRKLPQVEVVTPARDDPARELPRRSTTSVLSGRCGPCCSIAPIGRQRIEVSFR